ncbi:hypothetical protein M0802_009519 [Mischocyttarus mexicanus]|nr:hypothetical protein M0802_009519 [Mischocyttarus mexicanus]
MSGKGKVMQLHSESGIECLTRTSRRGHYSQPRWGWVGLNERTSRLWDTRRRFSVKLRSVSGLVDDPDLAYLLSDKDSEICESQQCATMPPTPINPYHFPSFTSTTNSSSYNAIPTNHSKPFDDRKMSRKKVVWYRLDWFINLRKEYYYILYLILKIENFQKILMERRRNIILGLDDVVIRARCDQCSPGTKIPGGWLVGWLVGLLEDSSGNIVPRPSGELNGANLETCVGSIINICIREGKKTRQRISDLVLLRMGCEWVKSSFFCQYFVVASSLSSLQLIPFDISKQASKLASKPPSTPPPLLSPPTSCTFVTMVILIEEASRHAGCDRYWSVQCSRPRTIMRQSETINLKLEQQQQQQQQQQPSKDCNTKKIDVIDIPKVTYPVRGFYYSHFTLLFLQQLNH